MMLFLGESSNAQYAHYKPQQNTLHFKLPSCSYNVIRADGESLHFLLQKGMNVLAMMDIILPWPVGGLLREVTFL